MMDSLVLALMALTAGIQSAQAGNSHAGPLTGNQPREQQKE